MKILAIETSCDDTSIAILEIKKDGSFNLLSNIVSSQVKLHAKYGGVYPFLAKREHQKNLPIVFKKTLKETGKQKFDSIAVTNGPGLEPCLWVGINFAKKLAKKLKLPLIPVNHIEAHIFANWLTPVGEKSKKIFPAICLVVSGGHTQLVLMNGFGKYKILGETRDDAAGECFDKTARILGLGYPGGPAIAKQAAKYKLHNTRTKIELPRPMIYHKNYDFSFSGLKTAVLYLVKQLTENDKKLTIDQKREISAEIQQAVIDVLSRKTLKAVRDCKAKSIILGGGVAANDALRQNFKLQANNLKINFLVPPKDFCTDNAAMTAIAAYFHLKKKRFRKLTEISADANLRLS